MSFEKGTSYENIDVVKNIRRSVGHLGAGSYLSWRYSYG
ncbi:hypothetical protein MADA3029_420062 [Vibrio nigripulchritudo MADA3029]|nr:hypothetical protein VIBNIMADA3020_160062 [Vibrio nigripulchritudo MADA3020]CCN54626.1 hypothetical protein VIBNIMADA3021_560115 [Vibrio nigripulchritudo MADA3021]CCN59456.1 hypothetical protein MADA3029_420062 [Vibrio nigripulchritudo MADA3029]